MSASSFCKTIVGILVGAGIAVTSIAGGFYTLFKIVGYVHNG